ncbi:hypothetical protein, conserved [Trypanosoma brucei gambiense DAL972]|uniref:Transmembrane protein n=1 Tax=Trypanosoma brucei gambiense (strain MHOM/CI/86/DAL972) TaxID=679716 RepID=D0AAH3_TRYB9|nr:hypothetical protein, conserved [Trypanosoma brucei gambiense DAL972]CBH18674.1 hypothetical protein, conserved [Trypanosoma brucei gambiense DAL972]|eukprot:XP_011780938.1 hypothetical protein, conserved [Trypanosoma brucei gambiense DAL972]
MNPTDLREGAQPLLPAFPPPPGHSSSGGGGIPDSALQFHGGTRPLWATATPAVATAPVSAAGVPPSQVGFNTGLPSEPQGAAYAGREGYADAAIRASADFWKNEQARRVTMEQATGSGCSSLPGEFRGPARAEFPSEELEFHTGSPKYVLPVSLLLAVGLFGAIPLMSSFAFAVLLTGCIVTYVVDYAGYRLGGVFAIIATTLCFGFALFLSNLRASITFLGPLCMILTVQGLLTTTAMAAFLHFHWLQVGYPELVCLMERSVLGVTPMLVLPSLLSSTTAFVGSRHAPAWFLLSMCAIHCYFYRPLESSFVLRRRVTRGEQADLGQSPKRRGKADDDGNRSSGIAGVGEEAGESWMQINGKPEAVVFTVLLLVLPATLYVAFQRDLYEAWLSNIVNVVGMVCVQILYLFWKPERSLWFLLSNKQNSREFFAHDSFGLCVTIYRYRSCMYALGALILPNWCVYRLLNSRYRFLFDGVAPPINGILLSVALYAALLAAYMTKKLLDADKEGRSVLTDRHMKERVVAIVAAAVSAVFVGFVVGLPGPLMFNLVICLCSFNLFLIDRGNAGLMFIFAFFSSLLLAWWMSRTFSFVILRLHVFGESRTIPSPALAGNILSSYFVGCMSFPHAFTGFKFLYALTLFLQSLNVVVVEHILYSQKEDGVYPAVLVLFTSVVGVLLVSRLHRNGVLGAAGASLVASSYIAKLFKFLVEVTGSYYVEDAEMESSGPLFAVEITTMWWAALLCGFVAMLFELEKVSQMGNKTIVATVVLFAFSAMLMVASTVRNFQRATYEFLTKSQITEGAAAYVFVGMSCIVFGALTYPFSARHLGVGPIMRHLNSVARGALGLGIIVLASQAIHLESAKDEEEFGTEELGYSKQCVLAGMLLVAAGRYLPMASLPMAISVIYWLVATFFLVAGLGTYLLPTPSVLLLISLGVFVYFTFVTLDVAHYREKRMQYLWMLSTVAVCFAVFSVALMGRGGMEESDTSDVLLIWETHVVGLRRLLSVVSVTGLFTAILLKFRLGGEALLPGAVPITSELMEHIGVVVNYNVILSVTCLTVLNMWNHDYEPGLHVVTSLLLLLLVKDDTLFLELDRENYRYFPPLAYALGLLWGCLIHDAYRAGGSRTSSVAAVLREVLCALPLAPSHISLLSLVYASKKAARVSVRPAVAFVLVGIMTLLFSSQKAVQWMAVVGICGHSARLLEAQLMGFFSDVR